MFTASSDPSLPYVVNLTSIKIQVKSNPKKSPQFFLFFFLNLNLFPGLTDHVSPQIFAPAQLKRQGRSRRRQILVEAEKTAS